MKSNFAAAFALLFAAVASVSAQNVLKPLDVGGFCEGSIKNKGFLAANGTQIKTEPSCVSLPIGELPPANKMVSALIIEPSYGQEICKGQNFTVFAAINNLETGFFSDPVNDYYEIAQELNDDQIIKGHSHITIQKLDKENQAPDAAIFAFFKGLNLKAVDGVLSQEVGPGGLPATGIYRICTMNASNSHQPVVMPGAARGAQDDCIRVKVVDCDHM